MIRLRLVPLLAITLLGVGACIAHTNDVTLLQSQRPSLPANCPVSVIADATPPFPVEDLAVVTIRYSPGGHDRAMHELSDKTCYYGGDTVYAIEENLDSNTTTLLKARVAHRTGVAPSSSGSATP